MTTDVSADKTPVFSLTTSRGFKSWLSMVGGSLAFTAYKGGKVFFLGTMRDGSLSISERSFPRCMGLAVSNDARSLFLATQIQL